MFSGRFLFGVCEGDPFVFLFFEELFGDVFVDIETEFVGFGFEGGEVGLYSFVELLGELPDGFVGLSVEIVVAFGLLIVEDLIGFDEFVNFFGVHLFILNYLLYSLEISFNLLY